MTAILLIGCLASRMVVAADSSTIITFEAVPGGLEVRIGGKPFTTYHHENPDGAPLRRPYLYPVLADDGTPVTSDQHLVPGGDHPHHRSLWVGHGDVNGEDHWGTNDLKPAGPREVPAGRPETGGHWITQRLEWDCGEDCLLTEERLMEFAQDAAGLRTIAVTSRLTADRPVTLGDTKEAGLVAVRVAAAISASPAITTSTGCLGEPACWGRPAGWCDVSGRIGRGVYGVAVLDHPENPRFPTRWHVRGYGLLAANPFGLSEFDRAPKGTGAMLIGSGERVVFRHLVVVHRGRADAAGLTRVFDAWSGSPGPALVPVDSGSVSAFWKAPAPNPWWSYANGVLTGRQDPDRKGSVLESRDTFRDVIVDLEYRYSGDVDSGVFLRAGQRWQCQIGISRSLQRDLTGSIYDSKRKYVAEATAAPALNRIGEWNRLRVEARGDRFRHWLNGMLVLDYTDPEFTGSGPIGLQLHPGVKDMRIEFRNIRVLPLEPPVRSAAQ